MTLVKTQLRMIDAAAEAGVKRFLPSEFGFDLTIPSNRRERVYEMKIAVADKLKQVAEKYPGFTYTLLAIGSSIALPGYPRCLTDFNTSRWLCRVFFHCPCSV